jgi:hypothetical protein
MQTPNKGKSGRPGDMNHPGNEEWMAWLYDEATPAEKARLAAHLKECDVCRASVQRWQSARAALNFGEVAAPRVRARNWQPALKWAIAAGFVLAIGIGVGRMTARTPGDYQALRASLKTELLAELQQEQARQFADYKTAADTRQSEDNKLFFTALGKVEADRVADYASLRKELETVAVATQDGFQQTDQQIITLANSSQNDGGAINQ